MLEALELGFAAGVEKAKAGAEKATAPRTLGVFLEAHGRGTGAGAEQGGLGGAQESEVVRVQQDGDVGGLVDLGEGLADGGFDEVGGEGEVPDEFTGDFEGELDEGVFALLAELGQGMLEGLEDAGMEFHQLGPLLEQLLAEGAFAFDPSAFEGGLEFLLVVVGVGGARGGGVQELDHPERGVKREGAGVVSHKGMVFPCAQNGPGPDATREHRRTAL